MKSISVFVRAAIALALFSTTVWAQFETAAVLGTVSDPSRLPITKSKVTLTSIDTGVSQSAVTDDTGNYQFFNVKIGRYKVAAEAAGFKTGAADEFTVTVNARQRVDLALQIGQITETVNVEFAVAQLETDNSSRGTVIGGQQIVDLPLNGRSYADLALLSPGVRKSDLAYGNPPRDASFNVNGMRSSQNNFLIDGVDNNFYGTSNQGFTNQVVQLAPDAAQEFRVETSSYSAEYGRAGGAIVNVSVRSGSNNFHGAVWEYVRNTSLNAVGFFKPLLNQKPTLNQNQFGASIGGPILKDRLFFFGDYEGFRRTEKAVVFNTIPTLNQRNGIFSAAIRNPFTGEVFSNGVVPQSQITSFAKAVFAELPEPNVAGATSNNLQTLPAQLTSTHKGDIRIDHYLSSKVSLQGRYSYRRQITDVGAAIPGLSGGNTNGHIRVASWQLAPGATFTLNSRSVLEVRVGVSHTDAGKTPWFVGEPSVASRFNLPNYPTDARFTGGLYGQSISGYTGLGVQGSNPQFQNPTVINPKVNYSVALGRHSVKAGWELQAIHTEIDDFNPKAGGDTYAGRFSQAPGTATNNEQFVADFLFGARSNYTLNNAAIVNYQQRMNFFYVQDDWKVRRNLTINAGLRYEYATPQYLDDNKLSNYDPVSNTLIQAKDGSMYDRSLVRPDRNNFAPRLGIAWTLNPRTVIRTAYGISYIHFNRMGGENLLAYNLPNILNPSIDQQPSTTATGLPLCTSTTQAPGTCFRTTMMGYPDGFLSMDNVKQVNVRANYIPADFKTSYIQTWHLTVQRELAKNLVLDLGYVGTRGIGLMILADYNQARPNGPAETLGVQARRPIQTFGLIQIAWGGGFLDYHALQAKIEKRFSGGFYVLNSLTWSKSIDNASGHLEASSGDNSRANFADLSRERGLSGYDQPFNNTTTVLYELPFGRGRRWGADWTGLAGAVLGGWRLTAINNMNSGNPVNLSYSPSSTFQVSGSPTYRPNVIGDPMVPVGARDASRWLNPTTVVVPTDRTAPFGNAGRNIARAPSFKQLDLGLHKDFQVSEGARLSFRTEAFNLLNKTNLGAPNGNRSSGGFGTITTAYPARQIQFALKLIY